MAKTYYGFDVSQWNGAVDMAKAKNSGKDADKASDNLVEEMADVLIFLSQMQAMYDIPDHAIQDMIYRKCARQEARLNDAH
jgi:hypothetical protein